MVMFEKFFNHGTEVTLDWHKGPPHDIKVGMLIQVETTDKKGFKTVRRYLVGHVNNALGMCGCCLAIDDNNVITGWVQLIEIDEAKGGEG